MHLDRQIQARIGSVRNGVGCCSDYNEAFLLRAQAVGLQAREVHNLGHTTAEISSLYASAGPGLTPATAFR